MKKNKSLIDIFRCSPGENGFFFHFHFYFHSIQLVRLSAFATEPPRYVHTQEGSSRTHYLSFITSERRKIHYYLYMLKEEISARSTCDLECEYNTI